MQILPEWKIQSMFRNMFFGSAMLNPHIDGGFSQYVAVRNDQIVLMIIGYQAK